VGRAELLNDDAKIPVGGTQLAGGGEQCLPVQPAHLRQVSPEGLSGTITPQHETRLETGNIQYASLEISHAVSGETKSGESVRQSSGEGRFAGLAFHLDFASVFAEDLMADRQAQAGADTDAFRGEPGLENPLEVTVSEDKGGDR
jgi:hypothetical protein